jgi:excisionase family DNA binding protein
MNEPLTYTVEQTAQLLGIGRGLAYDGVRSGDIPSVRIGRRVLIPRHALLSLLNAKNIGGDAPVGTAPDDRETA